MCRTFDCLFWLPIDTIGLFYLGYSMTTVQRWVYFIGYGTGISQRKTDYLILKTLKFEGSLPPQHGHQHFEFTITPFLRKLLCPHSLLVLLHSPNCNIVERANHVKNRNGDK